MRLNLNFNSITFSFLVAFCLFFVLFTSISSPGGIDLINYRNESEKGLLYWDFYQGKEFVSWFLIKLSYFIADLVNLEKPVLILNLFLFFFISITLKKHRFKGVFISLALISPFGILLSQNVLRQYISCVFLFLFLIKLIDRNYLAALFLSIATFFSHHSSVIYLFIVFLSFCFNKHLVHLGIVIGAFYVTLLLKYLEFDFGVNDIDSGASGVGDLYKFYGYLILMIVVWVSKFIFMRLERLNRDIFYRKLSEKVDLLFFSALILAFFELPYWVLNRFFMTISFVIILFIVLLNSFRRRNMFLYLLFYLFILASSFLHPGARSILFY